MRKPVCVRLDNAVIDWFNLNGANLNGTINRVMVCLVRQARRDSDFAKKIHDIGKYKFYVIQ